MLLLVRSAGNFRSVDFSEKASTALLSYLLVKLRQIFSTCKATIGSVGNSDHALEQSQVKLDAHRWLGRRPRNRGVVMNPVDHPMGGGEGRASGGTPEIS